MLSPFIHFGGTCFNAISLQPIRNVRPSLRRSSRNREISIAFVQISHPNRKINVEITDRNLPASLGKAGLSRLTLSRNSQVFNQFEGRNVNGVSSESDERGSKIN